MPASRHHHHHHHHLVLLLLLLLQHLHRVTLTFIPDFCSFSFFRVQERSSRLSPKISPKYDPFFRCKRHHSSFQGYSDPELVRPASDGVSFICGLSPDRVRSACLSHFYRFAPLAPLFPWWSSGLATNYFVVPEFFGEFLSTYSFF